jgi:hypothetical protein
MGLGASRTIGTGGRSCGNDSRRNSRGMGAACGISRSGPDADGICSDRAFSRIIGAAGRAASGAGDMEGITGIWRKRCSGRGASGIADGLGTGLPGWRSS